MADVLAKEGATTRLDRVEPMVLVSEAVIREAIWEAHIRKWQDRWAREKMARQKKTTAAGWNPIGSFARIMAGGPGE